jgi:hypothetical protein
MTNEEYKRVKAQLLQGEESLRKHYDFSDISTLVGLINTCIRIMQSNEEWIEIMEVNNKSLKAEIETEKKVNNLLMQDVRDKSKELFEAELKHKLYKAKQEGLTSE